jgi:hypothetical protein
MIVRGEAEYSSTERTTSRRKEKKKKKRKVGERGK